MRNRLLALLLVAGHLAFGWGKQGHVLVAQIAKSQVDKSVAAVVDQYLKGMSWEETACWMDDAKAHGGGDYMKEWHYLNLPKDKTYVKSKVPDVMNQLDYYIRILKNRTMFSVDAVHDALKVIFHLVGDICQPLHCGYPEDRGGTLAHVRFLEKPSTLHRVWDSEIIEEQRIDLWSCSKTMLSLSPEEKKEIKDINVVSWVNDSRGQLEAVYNFKDNAIDKDYIERNKALLEKQLVKAGLRLAAILDTHFK